MTKKDYDLVARIISHYSVLDGCPDKQQLRADIADSLANAFSINPRFKRDKFLKACGVAT